jgi:3-isopropylmalate dehydrogenase
MRNIGATAAAGTLNPAGKPDLVIGILRGEGVGPEVIAATLEVLDEVARVHDLALDLREGPEVGADPELSDDIAAFFEGVFASNGPVLCGPAGGRFVYELRQQFDLFYKLVPLRPLPRCADLGPLKPERCAEADILVVRENISGLYFGEWGQAVIDGVDHAYHRFGYRREEVERVIRVGAERAAQRRRQLCAVVKTGGIPAISALWRDALEKVTAGMDLEVTVLEIDNAAYQLINAPRQFDVIVTPNMFGDVLGDCGALLLGARGMSFSGNFDADGHAVYQTAHGAAHDIAGTGTANPVGQILSAAMLLRETFGLDAAAQSIEAAVDRVLADGVRTADIAARDSRIVETRELGRRIAASVALSGAGVAVNAAR